ncbi:hypothetical protein MVES_001032 [Malassezia vespertilionis]|uniref:RING-type domain-containing protein n=1 Tax=Malassezia vespertilionis TaxID=2020962 RepID=A0A2N1JF09_9BASI|nr:hypothetical protein MVES_001032 [Malassezia vespertilionis]
MSTSSRSLSKYSDTILTSWHNFSFFESRPAALDSEQAMLPVQLQTIADRVVCVEYVAPRPDTWPGRRGALVFGTDDGYIYVMDAHTYTEIATWHAHGTLCAANVTGDGLGVISVGTDGEDTPYELCVWMIRRKESGTYSPTLTAQGRLHDARSKLCVLEVHPQLDFIAAGFEDGKVLLIRDVALTGKDTAQDLLRIKVARDATLVDEPAEGAELPDTITGLAFTDELVQKHGSTHRTVHLLIATVSKTLRYTALGSSANTAPTLIDTTGSPPGCAIKFLACSDEALNVQSADESISSPLSYKMVLARDEAIYLVGAQGREASIALEGPKSRVYALHGQLVVLSTPGQSHTSTIGGDRPLVFDARGTKTHQLTQVTVFDLDTKCVTYTALFGAGVKTLWTSNTTGSDSASFFSVVTHAAQKFQFQEKSLQEKLEYLFRMHLYLLAVPFLCASVARFPRVQLPVLASSAVILPAVQHERRVASSLTMLIADVYRRYGDYLYAKGDFEGAVLQFIKTIGVVPPSYVVRKFLDAQRLQFLTRYLQALHTSGLANADHTTLLLNCYTKLGDTDALDRFLTATDTEALAFDVPVAISVCRRSGFIDQAAYLAKTHKCHEAYLSIQLRDKHNAAEAIDYLQALAPPQAEYYVQQYAHVLLNALPAETTELLIKLYTRAEWRSPAPLFSSFVGHPTMLVHFLETLAALRWDRKVLDVPSTPSDAAAAPTDNDETLVFHTLLELYLSSGAYQKALYLLQQPSQFPYVPTHAMLLCATQSFTQGLLFLYERLGMIDALFQHWIDASHAAKDDAARNEATRGVLLALERFGDAHPHLYITVLQYLASSSAILDQHCEEFGDVLEHIDEHNLLSPPEVVQLVSATDVVPMGMISAYLMRHIRNEHAEVDSLEKLTVSYQTETASKLDELEALTSNTAPRVFQNHRCGLCHGTLDLPNVHFMCKHSFHQRCLPGGEAGRECPLCAQKYDTMREVQQDNALYEDHEILLSQVHAADDGFDDC